MLYTENRKGGKKGGYSITVCLFLLLFASSCSSGAGREGRNITVEAFSELKTPVFVLDNEAIRTALQRQADSDRGTTEADRMTRHYYRDPQNPLAWIDRMGVDERADTLLAHLRQVSRLGMSEQAFAVEAIEHDLQSIRTLDVGNDNISNIAARLEYRLTKACLRYCCGQRFGFVNPQQVFNRLDAERTDSMKQVVRYRGLFDVAMDRPTKDYARQTLRKVMADSLADYLEEIEPRDDYYRTLLRMLPLAASSDERKRIMVNMDRARWRRQRPIANEGKYIVVNIPAYHLYAYSPQETLDMRVVCGNAKTKTPQLTSDIEWMEVNPQWVIPMSIIENEVSHRAGDTAYFARNRYNIYDRATNQQLPAGSVTRQMLLSGKYRVAQEGGAGNSLGRIVFRFKNNFSVFLHDTSNPGAFQRDGRAMSHGCVRVAKPFDLARFVLDEPDEWKLDRIRIAMGLPAETPKGIDYEQQHPEAEKRNKLIGYVPVKPVVPLYIIYNTLWPDENGIMQTWKDCYGYDDVMWNQLKPFTEP